MFSMHDTVPAAPAEPGIVRRIMNHDESLMLVELTCSAEAVGTEATPFRFHTHPHHQITYIVSGAFRFCVDGEERVVRAGDSIRMDPDVPHGMVCLEPGVLLDCFSPMRRDFLK